MAESESALSLTLPEQAALVAAQKPWAPQGALNAAAEAILAARLAPIEALAAEYPMCWVHKSAEIFCTDLIGATFPNGTEFTAGACCLPCRLRAALADPQPEDRR